MIIFDLIKFTTDIIIESKYIDWLIEYLENDIVQLSTQKTNPYSKHFSLDIEQWDTKLNWLTDIIELLI